MLRSSGVLPLNFDSRSQAHRAAPMLTAFLSIAVMNMAGAPCARAQEVQAQETPDQEPSKEPINVQALIDETADALARIDAYVPLAEREKVLRQVRDNLEILVVEVPQEPRLAYFEGKLLAAAGRPREAVSKLQAFVDTREGRNDWRTFRLMGDLLVEQYPRLARSHYARAESLHPGDVGVKYGLAQVAAQTGRRDEAISTGRELVQLDGEKKRRYMAFLARVLLMDSQWDEAGTVAADALELFDAAAKEQRDVIEPLLGVDGMFSVQVQSLRARMALVEPSPADFEKLSALIAGQARNRLAINLFEAGRVFEEGLVRFGDEAPVSFLMAYGDFLREVGRHSSARAKYERVLEKEPDHAGAREALLGL
ncbi:MAG: tetratricopeptide repeat protein [Planctomycetota bacterium]